jgi:hypothetical protein
MLRVSDMSGTSHDVLVRFMWRYFGARYIRETRIVWHGDNRASLPYTESTGRFIHDAEYAVAIATHNRCAGEPTPAPQEQDWSMGEISVYCDHLHFCPDCGRFWLPDNREDGMTFVRQPQTDSDAYDLLEARKSVPEFTLLNCGAPDLCEKWGKKFRKQRGIEMAKLKRQQTSERYGSKLAAR